MRTLVIVGLCTAMSGCYAIDQQTAYADRLKSEAEIAKERAAIMKLYRGCLEKYQDDPVKAKQNCEHYTQALYSVDVRGMK
ncbi:MAG: hypothetical protein WCH20_10210 [Nitrospira sp.]